MRKEYEQWSKFDVNAEMEKMDDQEKREDRQHYYCKLEEAKTKMEQDLSFDTQMTAAALKSHAAVAALKAKQQKKHISSVPDDVDDSVVQVLQMKAQLVSEKSQSLKLVLELRNAGQECFQSKNYKKSIVQFQYAIEQVRNLDEILKKLEKISIDEASSKEGDHCHRLPKNEHVCNEKDEQCCPPRHRHCNNFSKFSKKPLVTFPISNDLSGVLSMFLRDCYVGIAKCQLQLEKYASAIQLLKDVLLEDRMCIDAWIERGNAFRCIGLPLLAMLHYSQVLLMDPVHDQAKDEKAIAKKEMMNFFTKQVTDEKLQSKEEALLHKMNTQTLVSSILELRKQADSVMLEAFYSSAIRMYNTILTGVGYLNEHVGELLALKKTRLACHINIASCYLNMQANYNQSIHHCKEALKIEPQNAVALFRLGQALHANHQFEAAITTLQQVGSMSLNKEQFSIWEKEMEKCRYDQDNLDPIHVRQMLQ